MESKKLEALLLAADLGSFTKAAEILGYTQSGLTHMMNNLEKEIGFQLLERGHYGVRLTKEGKRLSSAMRQFLQANAYLDNAIEQLRSSQRFNLRIVAYASMATHWLPAVIQLFRRECPEINIDIRIADHVDNVYEALMQGKADAIFASKMADTSCDWIGLYDDDMYAVLPQDYAIESDIFPIEYFSNVDFIMPSQGFDKDILYIFNENDIVPNVLPTAVDDQTVVNMVEHGLGISMMTELMLKGRASNVHIMPVMPHASRELGIAVRSLDDISPALQKLIECTKAIVQPHAAKQTVLANQR